MTELHSRTKATLRDVVIIVLGLAGAFGVIYWVLQLLLEGWALTIITYAMQEVRQY